MNEAENTPVEQVAPVNNETQSETVDTTAEVSDSPETASEKEEKLLAGKFASPEELERSYLELQSTFSRKLNDPQYIYERARSLGLTEEEAQAEAQAQQPSQQLDYGSYQYFRSLEKAQEKYPSLTKDPEDQVAVTALMREFGLSPEKAAERYFSKINKTIEKKTDEIKAQGVAEKEQEEISKSKAQTISGSTVNADALEDERLIRDSKSLDRRTQDQAMLALLKKRMK